jgi:uncharacterized protein (DUF1697 family)
MADKKSILEEALLDVKNIQSALNANTREILRSVAREEIDSVVKESLLKEEGFEEEDLESTDDSVDLGGAADAATDDITGDLGGDDSQDGGLGDIEGSDEVGPEATPEMGGLDSDLGMDSVELGGEDMDMTAATDDDVIAIYKKLSGEDEIEIVGDEIHLNITEPGQYVVKAANGPIGGEAATTDTDDTADLVPADGLGDDEGGADYEIEMGDDSEMGGEEPAEDDTADLVPADGEEEETTEEPLDEKIAVGTGMSVGTHRNPTTGGSIGSQENPKSKLDESASKKLVFETTKKYNTLLTESNKLKAENEEFRKALKVFRNQLVETVVFNSNLTYTTRLFMEHSTTKVEKQNIIKRFDNEVSNLIESKKLYKTIANELETRKPIMESVENKLIKEVSTGSSKQLNESTAYVDPSTKRILDLINRTKI